MKAPACIMAAVFLAAAASASELLAWLHFGEDIPGDSSAAGREGWTDASGLGFVQENGGRRLRLHAPIDKASPLLMQACGSGREIREVRVDFHRSGGEFWQMRLSQVEVVAYEIILSPETAQPRMVVELEWESLVSSYVVRPAGEAPYAIPTLISGDADRDGLPDAYEEAAGLDPLVSNLGKDSDGDGLSDIDEYRLGTRPADPTSFFRVAARADGDVIELVWPSVAGKSYRIEFSPDLATPFQLLKEVTATGPETRHQLPRGGAAAFFRVNENPP